MKNVAKSNIATPVKPKLEKRFYEALVLQNVLGKSQGDRIDEAVLQL
jgi:hypothetical protein